MSIQSRIQDRVVVEDRGFSSACWVSTVTPNRDGYTQTTFRGRSWITHRLAYTVFIGPIPDGLQLDHLCRVRACCNPEHLEPVTNKVNNHRGESLNAQSARKTHCDHGHEYTEANTYRSQTTGYRNCRECRRNQSRMRSRNRYGGPNVETPITNGGKS
jgi:hypothetical protein